MKHKKFLKGFTLVEVIIALGILVLAIMGVVSVLSANLSNISGLENRLIASMLAQEGLEIVKNIRDSDFHAGNAFGTSLPDGAGAEYRVEWNSDSLLPLSGNPPLKIDSQNLYNYISGNSSIFHRKITIEDINTFHKKITVEVSWSSRKTTGGVRSLSSELHIYDWL